MAGRGESRVRSGAVWLGMGKTNVQIGIEQARALYEYLREPLLLQLAKLHHLSVRDFAGIFGISKSHAHDILWHRKVPTLELAVRMSRYFETDTDTLFAWRFDDDGARRPLVQPVEGGGVLRFSSDKKFFQSMEMVRYTAEWMKQQSRKEKTEEQSEISRG